MSYAIESPVPPSRDQRLEARVRVLGGAEAGEHAHRPQPPAMPGGMDAARERRLARQAEVAPRIPAGQVAGGVEAIDLDPDWVVNRGFRSVRIIPACASGCELRGHRPLIRRRQR